MKGSIVFSTLALAGAHWHGPLGGLAWMHVLVPVIWLLVVVLIIVVVGRRWRHAAFSGGHGHAPWAYTAVRSAEATLAERFAQGDIDEKEYRARLEVLRASVVTGAPKK